MAFEVNRCLIHDCLFQPFFSMPLRAEYSAGDYPSIMSFPVPIQGNVHLNKILYQEGRSPLIMFIRMILFNR